MNIDKLPKWAQEHISSLERERDEAVKTLARFEDSQTESQIYYEQMPSDGRQSGPSFSRRYINGATHGVTFNAHGVQLDVRIHDEGPRNQPSIGLSWSADERYLSRNVAVIPTGYQQLSIVAQANMQ